MSTAGDTCTATMPEWHATSHLHTLGDGDYEKATDCMRRVLNNALGDAHRVSKSSGGGTEGSDRTPDMKVGDVVIAKYLCRRVFGCCAAACASVAKHSWSVVAYENAATFDADGQYRVVCSLSVARRS